MSYSIKEVTREIFIKHLTDRKEDSFAKTFRAKCDMMDIWDECVGVFEGEQLCCAMVITISKRAPKMANIQLIHTFFEKRGKGLAKLLTESMIASMTEEMDYLRVSAEKSAVGFYKKIGFKFLGEQKSGCQLSVCKVNNGPIGGFVYDINDPIINKAVYRKGKGGCVKIF